MAIAQARMRFVHARAGCVGAGVMHARILLRERDALTGTPACTCTRQHALACMPPMMFAFACVDKVHRDTRMLRRGIVSNAVYLRLADTGFGTRGFPTPPVRAGRIQIPNASQVLYWLAVGAPMVKMSSGCSTVFGSREVLEWTAPDRRTIRLPILKA